MSAGQDAELSDLTKLCWRFPQHAIKVAPKGGGSYVSHFVVEQRLLMAVGPPETKLVEIVRGWVPGVAAKPGKDNRPGTPAKPALELAVVGVVLRMTIKVDGVVRTVEETGDVGNPQVWEHDGQRLKDAFSDAYKRCAMRFGVGLHLWCKDVYDLDAKMADRDKGMGEFAPGNESDAGDDQEAPDTADAPTDTREPVRPATGQPAADAGPPVMTDAEHAAWLAETDKARQVQDEVQQERATVKGMLAGLPESMTEEVQVDWKATFDVPLRMLAPHELGRAKEFAEGWASVAQARIDARRLKVEQGIPPATSERGRSQRESFCALCRERIGNQAYKRSIGTKEDFVHVACALEAQGAAADG